MLKKKAVVSLVAGTAMLASVGTSAFVFAGNSQAIPKNVLYKESKQLLTEEKVTESQKDKVEGIAAQEGYLSLEQYVNNVKETIKNQYGMDVDQTGFHVLAGESQDGSTGQVQEETYQDLIDQFETSKVAKLTWWEHGVAEPKCIVALIDQDGTVLECESHLKEHQAKADSYLSYEEYIRLAKEAIKKEYGVDVTSDKYMALFYSVPEKVEVVEKTKNYQEMKEQFETQGAATMTWWEIGGDGQYIVSIQADGTVTGYGVAE